MITRLPAWFDTLLALPMPLLAGFLLAYWGLLAVLTHRVLVPWIAGRRGQKLGHLEAEVPAQIGLAFGLLISFIAIPVWDQHNRAEDAARSEAAAYRDMYEAVEDSDVAEKATLQRAIRDTIDFLAVKEWPQMARLLTPRVTAPPVRELRAAIHTIPESSSLHTELHDLFRQATDARESRLLRDVGDAAVRRHEFAGHDHGVEPGHRDLPSLERGRIRSDDPQLMAPGKNLKPAVQMLMDGP